MAYGSDLHAVRELAIEVARQIDRVLASPRPVCQVTGFGDSAVEMLLRFWIEDPTNGVTNIKGEVLLGPWSAFNEKRIEIPFPQREVIIREGSLSATSRVKTMAEWQEPGTASPAAGSSLPSEKSPPSTHSGQ